MLELSDAVEFPVPSSPNAESVSSTLSASSALAGVSAMVPGIDKNFGRIEYIDRQEVATLYATGY